MRALPIWIEAISVVIAMLSIAMLTWILVRTG